MSKIAIFMSTFNGERYVGKQLESLAKQNTESEIDLYIRDDGSTDKTDEIINYWKRKINIYYYKGKNCGPAKSFWELFLNDDIQADYYAFCDQDDIWDSDKIEVAIKHLKGDTHLYASNCRIIDQDDNLIEKRRIEKSPGFLVQQLFVCGATQGCSMVFTKELRDFIFSKKISCVPMHDLIVLLYSASFGRVYWDNEPHFSYRYHANNVVAKGNKKMITRKYYSLKRWIKNRNQMKTVAKELIENRCFVDEETLIFLNNIISSTWNIHSKIELCKEEKIKKCEKDSLRSFRMRVFLGII